MADDRPRTPRPVPRIPPRDTDDVMRDAVRDFARDLEAVQERFDNDLSGAVQRISDRLERGVESFTRLDERVTQAEHTAKAANDVALRAAAVKPIPWVRVVPILLVLLTGFAGVVATMARTPSRDFVDDRIAGALSQARALEGQLVELQKQLIELRGHLTLVQTTLADALARQELINRRLQQMPAKGGK